ncbi:hypothetical protein ABL78_1682 [Leptomonas seymouri]|uniref:tRNA/rRNA methyltransferase SpoU type domain-containing protein n=1 Tax=Leptomonas seymouri TaxID=5684 RepID=A0A0N1I1U8_LEPSE|nr:hypothetical protein ABL78_1682 [Leptomonas seymouri]|eukprot:KPI89190.1 hypothetical protein ABL78_1682 [Leptomonas seymouri]
MRAFTRGLLRQVSHRPPLRAPPHPPIRRSGAQAGGRKAYRDNGGDSVAEAQIVFATPSSTPAKQNLATPTPFEAEGSVGREPRLRRRPLPPPTPQYQLSKPLVLDDVQDTYALSPTQQLHGQWLWNGTRVLRCNTHLRQSNAACVVGGASAIRRIWRTYRIRPTVVYVPNTEPGVPAWCLEADLPSVVVRCSPVAVKRQLLSAEYSDGFAAEFPLPVNTVSDAASLLATAPEEAAGVTTAIKDETTVPQADRPLHNPFGHHAVKAMLVLVGLRIPSNVGALLRAAVEMGYDAAVLVNCVDATQEKVLRASDGTALSPTLRIYETDATEQASVSLLSSIAAQHHLMPFLALPSQEVDPAFEVAKRFHMYNNSNDRQKVDGVVDNAKGAAKNGLQAPTPPHLGAMVVLGSEAQGLRDLRGTWGVPYQLVTLPLPNPMVDSYNVSVAGSVLLHLFRPAAAEHFGRLVALSGETVASLPLTAAAEEADDEEEFEESPTG